MYLNSEELFIEEEDIKVKDAQARVGPMKSNPQIGCRFGELDPP